MSDNNLRLAKDLVEGDSVLIHHPGSSKNELMTISSIVASEQMVKRYVLLFTLQRADGTKAYRTFSDHSPVRVP